MAKEFVIKKIKRDLDMLGIAYTGDASTIVIDNGANDLTISYVDASIESPMGGVSVAGLGIGVANPGQIKCKFEAATVAACLDTALVIKAFGVCLGRGNDVVLEDSAVTPNQVLIRGSVDLLGMGM